MNHFAAHNPEAYEAMERAGGYADEMRARVDAERKERRENPPLKQTGPDRYAVEHDDREMCRACGELPVSVGIYCRRCNASLDDERESGR